MEDYALYEAEENKPDLDEELLLHYGVKGMRWRRRKGRKVYGSTRKAYSNGNKTPLEELYSQYANWYDNTKFGKFMNTPITELFKNHGSTITAEASTPEHKKDRWVVDPATGEEVKMDEEAYGDYSARRRRQTNRERTKSKSKW